MKGRRLTPKARKGLLLALGATLVLVACSILAQLPPLSKADSLGAPDKNVASGNCFCHTNTVTGKEHDPAVAILVPDLPDEVGTSTSTDFTVSFDYAQATSSWRYGFGMTIGSVDGRSLAGASLSSPFGTASQNNTHLTHNEPLTNKTIRATLTAPTASQTIKLTIIGNVVNNDGSEKGDHWNYAVKYITILKNRMIFINATVRNRGGVDASNVNVSLYINGELMNMTNIATIAAGKSQNITFDWDATKSKAGEYKVEIDLDTNNTVLVLNQGSTKLTKTIVLEDINNTGGAQFDWTTAVYWILGLIIVALVVGLAYKYYG